ncbi:hypothetical protein B0O80DRAFT_454041 [Mortierella sp. GBAus27b]|nr:hypothetical protein B0O80DRAFT_454041 [Mortierella sp. GBAus27b]
MGNTSTKEKSDHVDGGALLPHGVYSGPQDYDFRIVQRLILQRKLAPFYKGLEDWDDSEDALEEKEKLRATASTTGSRTQQGHSRSTSYTQTRANHMTEAERDMRRLYQGAIECPICFLYYPRNINRTRCCDKPMCTECFVQLKRLESAPTESPSCPYCVEPHFGVIYSPSLLPSGLLSSSPLASCQAVGGTSMSVSSSSNSIERGSETQSPSSPSTRRRSTSHKSPEVVTADELRPDWNRRILAASQRQPGSRRASTSSPVANATFGLGRRLAASRQGTNSRRSNSSTAASDYTGYVAAMRNMGADLEELMIMEAMRQSLQDEQERQAREAAAAANGGSANSGTTDSSGTSQHGESSRSGTATSRSPLSSPIAPSTSSSSSTTARRYARGSRARVDEGDTSSLATSSDGENDSDSDQERPELLHNEALRFARISMPARTPVTRKHRAQEGRTNAPEAV